MVGVVEVEGLAAQFTVVGVDVAPVVAVEVVKLAKAGTIKINLFLGLIGALSHAHPPLPHYPRQ